MVFAAVSPVRASSKSSDRCAYRFVQSLLVDRCMISGGKGERMKDVPVGSQRINHLLLILVLEYRY